MRVEFAHQQVRDKLETAFTDLGEQQVKNIARPVRIYRVALGGRAPADRPPVALPDKPSIAALPVPHAGPRGQEITFCMTKDGVNLAVASIGQGMPLVSIPTWLTHLEYDWQSPARAQLYHFLADRFRLIRYDARGFGLSDRKVSEISFATFERDLETVVDALGLYSYALLGISQGAATAIAHAVRHSQRVSKMVLHGGFARGRNRRDSQKALI